MKHAGIFKPGYLFIICLFFLSAGCSGSGDGTAMTDAIDIRGVWVLWSAYGEDSSGETSDYVIIEQTGGILTIRELGSGDQIATGNINNGTITINWIFDEAAPWIGRLSGVSSVSLLLPDNWTIEGIVRSANPGGLRSWRAERIVSDWTGYGSALPDAVPDADGHQAIIDAGLLPYSPAQITTTGDPTVDTHTDPSGDSIECKSQPYSERIISQLQNGTLVSDDVSMIYPGSLLQGDPLNKDGDFIPVKIARAGGKIFLSGLIFKPDAQYSKTVDEVTPSKIQQAMNDILTENTVQGTAANAIYDVKQVYSYDQMLLTLSIDAKFGSSKLKDTLQIDTSQKKNYVLATFTQIFYTMTFETPVLPENVFKDGVNFLDPDNNIRPGNPPLYISAVNYGRQVYLLVESAESAEDIKNTLNGAWSGAGNSVKVDSDLTYKDVMKTAKVIYWVRGGAADMALQPISSATPDQMYDAVKNFLAKKEAANFSVSNPGLPVSYNVKYLMNDKVVAMNMSAIYDRVDCHIAKSGTHKWTFAFDNVNYRLRVQKDGAEILNKASGSGGTTYGSVDFSVPDADDHHVSFVLSNGDCFSSMGNFYIKKDGIQIWSFSYSHGTSTCGDQMSATLLFNNRAGGQLQGQQCHVYRGATWNTGENCAGL